MGGASFRSYGSESFWFDQAERHYRMDMRTREVTAFDALTNTEKLRIALFEAAFRVPGEAGTKLLGLLSTTNLAITASVLAIWVGSHATPLGWVVDITMVGVGLIAIGAEAAEVAQELCLFANGIINASDEIQCRMAASHLARAVAIIGVDVVLAILLKKAVFTMKSRSKAPEAVPVPQRPAQQRTTPSQAFGRGESVPQSVPLGRATSKPLFENKYPEHAIDPAKIVPTERLSGISGNFNYVITEQGTLVVGRSGHTSLAGGAPVQAAGELQLYNGNIKWIDNASGHYQPSSNIGSVAEATFNNAGLNATGKFVPKVWVPNSTLPRGGAWEKTN